MAGGNKAKRSKTKTPWWFIGATGAYLLTKAKAILPLLKFGKIGGAIFTMIVSVWVYALIAPLELAIGLVAMLFVHELGHVIAAKQKGLPVSAPIFIPFMGALINMRRHPRDAQTEAYLAMGGPVLGTVGALAVFAAGHQWNIPVLLVVANIGFFLNLINLLPIHPLDGGRIVVAVTRWLWLLGLIGGLAVIVYIKSILFFVIWVMFAVDLYQKFIQHRGRGTVHQLTGRAEIVVGDLLNQGGMIPGEEHKRDLTFRTYSNLDGEQFVEVFWESIGINEKFRLPTQGLIRRVHVVKVEHLPKEHVEKVIVYFQTEFETYIGDRYYDVPPSARWKFGMTYVALAALLIYMVNLTGTLIAPMMASFME